MMKDCIVAKFFRFLKYNKYWSFTLRALPLSAYYRWCILHVESEKLHKRWGVEGKESEEKETTENYRYAYRVSYAVDRICKRTTWESKCLVRALTAQHMLKKKGIHSTLYLGCGLEEGKMVAHAWLRCGEFYVSGGNGEKYSVVDKFYA